MSRREALERLAARVADLNRFDSALPNQPTEDEQEEDQ